MLARSLYHSPSPLAPSISQFALIQPLARAQGLLEDVLSDLYARSQKENRSCNDQVGHLQKCDQLASYREILSQAQQILGFTHEPDNKQKTQIKQEQQVALASLLQALSQLLAKQHKHHAAKRRHRHSATFEKLRECLKAMEEVVIVGKMRGCSDKQSSKRSLLTEKLREAERQESQSQALLRTIRPPRPSVNLIEHSKVRDRTVPLKARNMDSLQPAQKFSFSEADSIEEGGGSVGRAASSRVLLSEMSWSGGEKERRARGQGVGCARCEIY